MNQETRCCFFLRCCLNGFFAIFGVLPLKTGVCCFDSTKNFGIFSEVNG